MTIRHDDPELERIETVPGYTGGYQPAIVRGFRKALLLVRTVANETELRRHRARHFEKLKGDRAHQWSMKINDQYRIVVEIEHREGPNNNCVVVKEIVDYH